MKVIFFILSGAFQFFTLSHVVSRSVSNLTLSLWLLSLILLFFAFPFQKVKEINKSGKIDLLVILLIVLALAIRIVLMQNANAFHNDEYISAYFSYSIGDLSKLDWFGIYPLPRDWIWQFPLLYFFFQKVFFNLFGMGTLIMRLSIVPYLLLVFGALFLIAKRLYSEKIAYLAIFILTFFAPDLYLSRWALHFISSTAFFLLASYFFVLSVQVGKKKHFALLGFFLGLCYLTYYSSYVTAPLLFFFLLLLMIKKQIQPSALKNFLFSLGIFLYTISPWAIYTLKVENFLSNRIEQVKLLNGAWSPYKELPLISQASFEALKNQAVLSVKSLYLDNIGGHGGYVFGNLALFDQVTFIFIILSLFYLPYRVFRKKDFGSLFLLATVFTVFVTGMVLTTPPPAFHRIALIFPFLCLLISVMILDLYTVVARKWRVIAGFLLAGLVLVILVSNISHFDRVLTKDGPDDPDYPQIQHYLEQQKKNTLYIAAFPSYGMGGILFIRSGGKITAITQPLDEVLKIIPQNKTSFLVILYPTNETVQRIKEKFPRAVVVANYQKHALLEL
ncbi:MAG: glycosyltransferase family 39 protein [Candidatus Shapirobacteria bacterium]